MVDKQTRWVQDRFCIGIDDEMVVFKRPNSPNWYCRYYVREENKYYQKSLKTKSKTVALEKAKEKYRTITSIISREEKVFNLSWGDAVDHYAEMEYERFMGGVITEEWYKKKISYLRNKWVDYVGADTPVNKIDDEVARSYFNWRLTQVERKETLRQELTIIGAVYKDFLVRKKHVLEQPRFPKLSLTKKDKSRRTDTFTVEEWEVLYKNMRRWVEWDEIPHTRVASTRYGKRDNKEKDLREYQRRLEFCRRNVLREFILISANLGTRPVSELMNIRWRDVQVKKTLFKNWHNGTKDIYQLTCNVYINSKKTGERNVNGIAGRYFNRLKEFYESEGVDVKPDDYVFVDLEGRRKGKQLDSYVLNRLFRELMDYCQLDRLHYTPYHLRHFYITQRLLAGVDLVLVSENAGNSPTVIMQSYSHVRTELATQELNKVRDRSSLEEIGVAF